MKPERWRLIEDLYHRALEKDAGQRSAFLREACAGDESLRRKIESLLDQTATGHFMSAPVVEPAVEGMADSNPPKPHRPPWWMYVVAASFVCMHALIPYLLIWGPADIEGLQAAFENGAMRIRAVESNSHLARAGLQAGDLVLAIDDLPVGYAREWEAVQANMDYRRVWLSYWTNLDEIDITSCGSIAEGEEVSCPRW